MIPQKRFKLKLSRQAILLATISAAYPVIGYCAAAGRVEFAIGNVESVAANGIRHPLRKGAEINAGDSISTGQGARAQLQFSDGGFISLQPGTQFRVDEYNYHNKTDGNERGFFSLLKGGFRAVTGFIGHLHRNAYRVRTPEATLGIRGTGYNMAIRDDGLFVNVGEGAVSLSNKAGLLVVSAGNAAFVANFNTAPRLTTQLPLTPPNGLKAPDFTVADKRDSAGNLTVLQTVPINLVSGSNYAMSYSYSGFTAVGAPVAGSARVPTPVTVAFDSAGQMTQYSGTGDTGSLGTGTVAVSASDGIIGWGRWIGAFTTTNPVASTIAPPGGVIDYVVGIPTAAMPTTGTATYSLLGFTTPTDTGGFTGYTVNGSLAVNFAAANSQVGVNMTVANGTYNYVTNGTVSLLPGTASFAGSITIPTNVVTAPNNCTGGCTTSINGFFAGTGASRAGLSYSIADNINTNNNVQGVAVFTKN
jgi:hypothetical protein